MTRWLITGAGGMLGQQLQRELVSAHQNGSDADDSEADRVQVTALSRAQLDITDPAAVEQAVAGHDIVVNAAAYTRVDDAETEVEVAAAVNATGAANLAAASARAGARLLQLSTDYVFDGDATSPYAEGAPTSPHSVYGRTKAEGERLALRAHPGGTMVLRTAWLYGAGGDNFVTAMLRLAARQHEVPVLADQFGQPTWTGDLARRIVLLGETTAAPGIYHATNSGGASRFAFAREIFRLAGLDPERVVPAYGDSFARPAPRPAYSVLGHGAWAGLGLPPMRAWELALADAAASGLLGHAPAAQPGPGTADTP